MTEREERKYRRFKLRYPVRVKFQSDGPVAEVESTSKNIGTGGLLLESAAMIPEDTRVTFVIRIEVERSGRTIYLGGQGRIVRVESDGAVFAIAVECDAAITQLEDYLLLT
jgi:PilZ domain